MVASGGWAKVAASSSASTGSTLTLKTPVARTFLSVVASFSNEQPTRRGLKESCISQSAIIPFNSPASLREPMT